MIEKTPYSEKSEKDWLVILIVVLVGLTFLFHLVGLGSTRWASTGHDYKSQQVQRREHIGLWRYCVDAVGSPGAEVCDAFINIIYSDWLKAAQSFMVLAFFAFLGSVGMTLLMLVSDFKNNGLVALATAAALFITGFFQFVAVVVFGCYYQTYFDDKEPQWKGKNVARLDWAFVISCLSCVACVVSAVMVLVKHFDSKLPYQQVSTSQSSKRTNMI